MNRITHFDIHADDPKRASNFYSKVFGWKFEKWNGPMEYWMITTGEKDKPGINGGMSKRMPVKGIGNINTFMNTIEVDSYDKVAKEIIKNKGMEIEKKMAVPGVGWMGGFKDTEGNIFSLMQMDKDAK